MLTPGHHDELSRSGLSIETIGRAGIYSATAEGVRDVLGYGAGPGLVFPYPALNGHAPYARVKIDKPGPDGKRYRSPMKQPNRLYIPALLDAKVLADPATPLWVTEGEKKSLKACQEGLPCIAVSGVWSWRTRQTDQRVSAPISDLDLIAWRGRLVYLVFDSDLATNVKVQMAESALAKELRRRGAHVLAIRLPGGPDGEKCGLDDYLLTHNVEALCAIEPMEIAAVAGVTDLGVWPPHQPVPNELSPVPPFQPAQLLPAAFVPWITDIAERAQCPIAFVAIAAVVAAGALVGRRLTIRPKRHDDWTVVPNLWGLAVGRPGVMKSPALQEAGRPLQRLVVAARADHEERRRTHAFNVAKAKLQREILQKRIKEALKTGGDGEGLRAEFDALVVAPPVERRYVVNDSTVEKLGELLDENPNGLLLFRDELIGFLRTMDREGHENDRAFYAEAWNGTGAYTYDRIGRGTVHIAAACISILGGVQPGPLHAYLREVFGRGDTDDGLIQRFQLMVYPDIAGDWRNVDRWPDSDAKTAAFEIYRRLADLHAEDLAAHRETTEDMPFLRFEPEAQVLFDTWRAGLERQLRDETEHPVVVSHLAKYRSLMPALALLLHAIDCVEHGRGGPVSATAATKAIAWCVFLEAHARRVYQSVTAAPRVAAAQLAARITSGEVSTPFLARQIRRKGWTGLSTPEDVSAGLDVLEDLHWVRRVELTPTRTGGRRTVEYHINPSIPRSSR